jgi:hypothetical protein
VEDRWLARAEDVPQTAKVATRVAARAMASGAVRFFTGHPLVRFHEEDIAGGVQAHATKRCEFAFQPDHRAVKIGILRA